MRWRIDFINGNWTQIFDFEIVEYFNKNYKTIKSMTKL